MTERGDSDGRCTPRIDRAPGAGILPALEGVALIVWHLVATPFIGRKRLRWGTIGAEATAPLAGDEWVTDPKWSYTLGVAIDASPEDVWPWVAQIGQGRGGFYSYQTLENMVGCRIRNTTRILPQHQHPKVGQHVYLHPTAPPLRVEVVDPPRALVLFGSPADIAEHPSWGALTWQFIVHGREDGGSRLLTRGRYDHASNWESRVVFGRFPLEVVSFVMSRKMMLEIKRLAERDV